MERLLKFGSVDAIPFYNCSWKTQSEWFQTGADRTWLGVPILIFGVFVEMLYFPIIYIIFKTNLIRHACYKIILLLTVTDMTAVACSCIISGILYIQGAVFCSYPTLIYISGGIALATWCAACSITVSLFFNRIISIAFQEYASHIEKRLAYTSMVLCVIYFFYIQFFTPPALFNSLIMAWIPDPLSEQFPSEEASSTYRNPSQSWNNWIFVSSMFVLFSVYCGMVKKLARGQKSKASRAIFIQCSIICFFNTITALVYNAIGLATPAPWIIVLGQFAWSINHGIPALIYVTMNDTIRREFLRLVFRRLPRKVDERTSSMGITATKNNTQSRI